jgi:hypothetical protein
MSRATAEQIVIIQSTKNKPSRSRGWQGGDGVWTEGLTQHMEVSVTKDSPSNMRGNLL